MGEVDELGWGDRVPEAGTEPWEYLLSPLGSWRPPPQHVDPRHTFSSGTSPGPDQGTGEVLGLNGQAVPLLGTFKAADSGVSGDVVSAPSSKTWIWEKV